MPFVYGGVAVLIRSEEVLPALMAGAWPGAGVEGPGRWPGFWWRGSPVEEQRPRPPRVRRPWRPRRQRPVQATSGTTRNPSPSARNRRLVESIPKWRDPSFSVALRSAKRRVLGKSCGQGASSRFLVQELDGHTVLLPSISMGNYLFLPCRIQIALISFSLNTN